MKIIRTLALIAVTATALGTATLSQARTMPRVHAASNMVHEPRTTIQYGSWDWTDLDDYVDPYHWCWTVLGNDPYDQIVLGVCATPLPASQTDRLVYDSDYPDVFELQFKNGLCFTFVPTNGHIPNGTKAVLGNCEPGAHSQWFIDQTGPYTCNKTPLFCDVTWENAWYTNDAGDAIEITNSVKVAYNPIVSSTLQEDVNQDWGGPDCFTSINQGVNGQC